LRSGEEIQSALRPFVRRWHDYTGGEREEAQSFLNGLVDAYGLDRQAAGMRFEYHLPAALVERLTDLNQEISEGRRPYSPFDS
jgi:hypothetical protein